MSESTNKGHPNWDNPASGQEWATDYGLWLDGNNWAGVAHTEPEAVALMRFAGGLSQAESEQLLSLARPEGWATVTNDEGQRVTLVIRERKESK